MTDLNPTRKRTHPEDSEEATERKRPTTSDHTAYQENSSHTPASFPTTDLPGPSAPVSSSSSLQRSAESAESSQCSSTLQASGGHDPQVKDAAEVRDPSHSRDEASGHGAQADHPQASGSQSGQVDERTRILRELYDFFCTFLPLKTAMEKLESLNLTKTTEDLRSILEGNKQIPLEDLGY